MQNGKPGPLLNNFHNNKPKLNIFNLLIVNKKVKKIKKINLAKELAKCNLTKYKDYVAKINELANFFHLLIQQI